MKNLIINEEDKNNNRANIIELISDKQNRFLTQFIDKNTSLFISSIFNDGIVETFLKKISPQ